MSGDQAILRTTLLDGLIAAARENVDAGNDGIALFELARVYLPSGEALPEERWRVGGIVDGRLHRRTRCRGGDLRRAPSRAPACASHVPLPPSREGGRDARRDGSASSIPRCSTASWGVFELDLLELTAPIPERILYDDVITFPPLRQDIAVVVAEEVEAAALVDADPRGRSARVARGERLRRLPR